MKACDKCEKKLEKKEMCVFKAEFEGLDEHIPDLELHKSCGKELVSIIRSWTKNKETRKKRLFRR